MLRRGGFDTLGGTLYPMLRRTLPLAAVVVVGAQVWGQGPAPRALDHAAPMRRQVRRGVE